MLENGRVNVVVNIQGRLIMSLSFPLKDLTVRDPTVLSVELDRVVFYAVSVVQQSVDNQKVISPV
jgi:hypothetical protein